jgi:ribosomal-protein-alanine N-acetyltransferase
MRRQGHARALVRAAAEEAGRRNATEMFLEVATDNSAALALYTGLGFERAGQRRLYYARAQGAADALILRAALPLSQGG